MGHHLFETTQRGMIGAWPLIALILAALLVEGAPPRRYNCPSYEPWSKLKHLPASGGRLQLPSQRPLIECRTFTSKSVEKKIKEVKQDILDRDAALLFENAYPNTLDTTIKWHRSSPDPLSFVVTGDINAEWLRDSYRQLSVYIPLCSDDEALKDLIRGAIALQSRYVIESPYCNAFQPPPESGLRVPPPSNSEDKVWPKVNPNTVFECKFEIDSLAAFLGLSREYFEATGDSTFLTSDWRSALARILFVVETSSVPTVNETTSEVLEPAYKFQRNTDLGTETISLKGWGNPVRFTGMVRSWFRPSDDATIYQFFVPGNAELAVELGAVEKYLDSWLSKRASAAASTIKKGIMDNAVFEHPKHGKVFAYEVDGFGGRNFMDDANIPSLLSLPDLGFCDSNDEIYLNTRRMVLDPTSNPYYYRGPYFEGIGGPHAGIRAAWPLSRIVAMRTTDSLDEIRMHLRAVVNSTKGLGLIHETVDVDTNEFSRPWFSWANSEYGKTILNLRERGLLRQATKDLL